MNLHKCFLTKNECYQRGVTIKPCGVLVHSTGANNPWLKRYVQPDDGLLGNNPNGNHFNTYRPGGRQVCVHAFIGKLADGNIATYQTLPWTMRGWHSGVGSKGSANNMGYIGFEICEDGLDDPVYFSKVYKEAVELTAYLCKLYNLNPKKDGVVICHSEGHTRGIASNHGDVMHWFPRHGKDMNTFRDDVSAAMKTKTEQKEDDTMTKEEFKKMLDQVDPVYKNITDVPEYWRPDVRELMDAGAIKGDSSGNVSKRRSVLEACIVAKRYVEAKTK